MVDGKGGADDAVVLEGQVGREPLDEDKCLAASCNNGSKRCAWDGQQCELCFVHDVSIGCREHLLTQGGRFWAARLR